MYNSQEIVNRIKLQAKKKNISLRTMLPDLELGINILSQFAKGGGMSSITLAKIADYLECSVDYLLGRTESPDFSNTPKEEITVIPFENRQLASIAKIYEQLDEVGKARLLVLADELRNKQQL